MPIPNHLLVNEDEQIENGDRERERDGEYAQQHLTTTTSVCLMPIHPDGNATSANDTSTTTNTTRTDNSEDDDDDNDSQEYESAEDWLRHHLLPQSSSSSSSNKKFVSSRLPVLSCGATHTSMIIPGSTSATVTFSSSTKGGDAEATNVAGDAHIVGTIFGYAHHHLTIQPSRLPLRIVRISSGRRHVLALTEGSTPSSTTAYSSFSSSGTVSQGYGAGVAVSWGAGHFGQLGHGTEVTSSLGPRIINRLLPHVVGGKVVEIAAGGLHSAAIVVPHYTTNSNSRRVVMYSTNHHSNSASGSDNNVVGNDGEVVANEILVRETRTFVWGSNRKGQCGIDGGKCATVPEPLPVVSVRRGGGDTTTGGDGNAQTDHPVDKYVHFEKLSLGRLHTVALTAYGEVFAWGSTSMGRCGQGGPTNANAGEYNGSTSTDRRFVQRPRHVSALRDVVIESIAAGGAHTLALSRGGRVYAWGAGGDGQCGQGHAGNLFSPRVVWGLPPFQSGAGVSSSTKSLSVGDDGDSACIPHVNSKVAMAVTLEEEALSKALSMSQIGTDNSIVSSSEPESDRVVSVRASGCYSAAITASGDIYTWGYGSGSAIGHPIPIENNLPYIPIIEGNQYSIATAAKVFPEGGSEDNVIRDCRCFDTDLNVMLPRRVECIRTLGLHVEDASLGPGHMVVTCSFSGNSDVDETQMNRDQLLLDNNDGIAYVTDIDTPSTKNNKSKGKQRTGASVSAEGLAPLGDARPSVCTSNASSNVGDSATTLESIESSASDHRRRSAGWISKIKPSSRTSKSNIPTSQSSLPASPEGERKKSFMQKLRRGHATACSGGGGTK